MKSSLIKIPVIVLLAFLLSWQGIVAMPMSPAAAAAEASCNKCCSPETGACAMPSCCSTQSKSTEPVPATSSSALQTDLLALIQSTGFFVVQQAMTERSLSLFSQPVILATGIPIFQRNCSYLL